MEFSTPLQYLKGVGPARARLLQRLELRTLVDLIEHYPRAYLDRTALTPLAALTPGVEATAAGEIRTIAVHRARSGFRNVHVVLDDGTGVVECVWFNQPFLERVFQRGGRLLVSGRVEWYRRLQFKNPEFETLEPSARDDEDPADVAPGIVPVYPLTAGISQKHMRRLMRAALEAAEAALREFLPADIRAAYRLMDWPVAVRAVHFPPDRAQLDAARRRIGFQELFDLQLLLAVSRRTHERPRSARPIRSDGRLLAALREQLPFTLTPAQERVIEEIRADLARDHPMHRLLEGDVGSGKTLVALAAALTAIEAGFQAAVMAPTEILAAQHDITFARYCKPLGVRTAALTGGLPARRMQGLRDEIASGAIQIAIGTHALIQESVSFRNLGLVVVDEQHRFGVLQRARLLVKGASPHALIMTATPIPRTLALTLFGDLDISVLDQRPAGRKPPRTHLVDESRNEALLGYIADQLAHGAQAYFVCPLIDASEDMDLAAAVELHEQLSRHPRLRRFRGALLHGRVKSEDKDAIMRAFVSSQIAYLVATTVIEVGIDVPNANLMVIEHPERYGLSQLHQLRGRIGRGRQPSHLFLLLRGHPGQDARRRLAIMVRENDGFRIAEEDLRQRGPGEFFGVRQSGLPPLKVANPIAEPELLADSRRAAFDLMHGVDLQGLLRTDLWRRMEARFGERIRLYAVG